MKQLKKYETPEMEITQLENADVICTSGEIPGSDDEETDWSGEW